MKSNLRYGVWCLLVACSAGAAPLLAVALKEGINHLDFNHDGLQDYVVVAQFDNNTSHPNLGKTFFIRRNNGGVSIMPVANSERFTWFDYRMSADAEFLVEDNQLFRQGTTYWLVNAVKKGDNPYEPHPFLLTYYRFTQSADDPGVPLYHWSRVKTVVTRKSYDSATQAWAEVDEQDLLQ